MMVCPFRVDIIFKYQEVIGTKGEAELKETKQTETYPKCMGESCPYYESRWNGEGKCRRAEPNDEC